MFLKIKIENSHSFDKKGKHINYTRLQYKLYLHGLKKIGTLIMFHNWMVMQHEQMPYFSTLHVL